MNQLQNTKLVSITPPAAIVDNASYTTASIDTQGWDYLQVVVYLGATDIAMTALKLQESDTDGSYSDVTGLVFGTSSQHRGQHLDAAECHGRQQVFRVRCRSPRTQAVLRPRGHCGRWHCRNVPDRLRDPVAWQGPAGDCCRAWCLADSAGARVKVRILRQWLGHKPGKIIYMADGVANTLLRRKVVELAEPDIETATAVPVMERAVNRGNKRGK